MRRSHAVVIEFRDQHVRSGGAQQLIRGTKKHFAQITGTLAVISPPYSKHAKRRSGSINLRTDHDSGTFKDDYAQSLGRYASCLVVCSYQ